MTGVNREKSNGRPAEAAARKTGNNVLRPELYVVREALEGTRHCLVKPW